MNHIQLSLHDCAQSPRQFAFSPQTAQNQKASTLLGDTKGSCEAKSCSPKRASSNYIPRRTIGWTSCGIMLQPCQTIFFISIFQDSATRLFGGNLCTS